MKCFNLILARSGRSWTVQRYLSQPRRLGPSPQALAGPCTVTRGIYRVVSEERLKVTLDESRSDPLLPWAPISHSGKWEARAW